MDYQWGADTAVMRGYMDKQHDIAFPRPKRRWVVDIIGKKRKCVNCAYHVLFLGADTAVMRGYMDNNSGYGFILLVIDFFSRYVWTKPYNRPKEARW
jgi:hypothetical protein